MFYDSSGRLKAIGAETLETGIVQSATRNNWIKYYGFKLHLGSHNATPIFGDLPPLKDIATLFSDFYEYLYNCLERDVQFVLTHPNGWGSEQQALMRSAMVRAGIILNDDSGHARISFVTEGEASLHFCLGKGLSEFARLEEGVTIIDAGGGMVDISTYSRVGTSRNNKSFQEITIPQCKYSGSVFVTKRAKSYLHNMLNGTAYSRDVDHISDRFDKTAKLRFKNPQNALDGTVVAGFFEPISRPAAFLVGGFAASDYLYGGLFGYLKPLGIRLSRPDSHVNKAITDGAISFYIDHAVTARMSRYFYGATMFTSYDGSDPEHRRRSGKTFIADNGEKSLDEQFDTILPKGIIVSENTEFHNTCHLYSKNLKDLATVSDEIICYRGSKKDPRWMDTEEAMYKVLCRVTANTRAAAKTLELQRRPDGETFYKLDYELVLIFGLTELQAYVSWKHKGKEKRGPARIVYQKDL
ncbi:hypothetical protein EV421DRAFT_1909608 [Armillaria borealis]|uniref:Actin-like ATPase domain-containing protein n=1 Tax=Armillaria borealis TaxID=47425 RepID=A0AA39J0Y5_9AGAR|nr:hypothetical protein EV421DRAFT_1909608 [Armillaria borealis]